MRSLVINLDRSTDRLAHMSSAFDAMGLPFERVPAVDGRLARSGKSAGGGDGLTDAELGCLLSHMACWNLAAASADRWTAIFEDDVHFSADAAAFLAAAAWIPDDADLIKLETFLEATLLGIRGKPAGAGHRVRPLRGNHLGSAGYIVSREAAARLLASPQMSRLHADRALFDFSRHPDFLQTAVIYQLDPAICVQDDVLNPNAVRFQSLIEPAREERRAARRAGRRLLPHIAQEATSILRKWKGRLPLLLRGSVRRRVPFGHPAPLHASASISSSESAPGTMVTGMDSPAQ